MTTERATGRRNRAFALLGLAAALCAVAAVTLAIEARSSRPDLAEGPVIPGFADSMRNAQRITVISNEATYHLSKNDHGQWVMRDRGDFPVRVGRVEVLEHDLAQLQYARRMTDDPARQDRLGVGDPRHGGHGVMLQVEDGRGAYLINLILGMQPTGGLFVRRPDQNQVWAARGDLPPLRDVSTWLDLKPLTLDPQTLARVEITPPAGSGLPYVLTRATADTPDFEIAGHPQAAPPSAVTATAEAMARLEPIDVQPAPAIQGNPRAHVRAVTFDGLAIEGDLIDSDGKTWLKLVARGTAATPIPAQDQAALAINTRAAGWAYAVSPQDLTVLIAPLTDLLPHSVTTTSPSAPENRQAPLP